MTRLLKIPIAARAGFASTSSCIDKLGGESRACTRNTPPGFWAKPAWLTDIATSSAPTVVSMRKCRLIGVYLLFDAGYQARSRGLRLVYQALTQGDDEEAITCRADGISRRRQNTDERRRARY